ncbi:MAG: DUF1273 family protein [Clostridia bacterium]|nr:DUF1273 family protein [Clostridia bacterium]
MKPRENCCCFTGHRYIANAHMEKLISNLPDIIKELAESGVTDFIAGGALGFDTLAAMLVIRERESNPDIRLILALPCKNQTSGWHKKDVAIYNEILSLADEVIYVSEEYTNGCMLKRNRFMVDSSAHCVFYMSAPRGGTAYTVKYALENELEMHNAMMG